MLSVLLSSLAYILSSWWTTIWTDSAKNPDRKPQGFYVAIYSALAMGSVLAGTWNSFLRIEGNKRLSLSVHNKALWSVFRSPSSYFDQTKSGRIINRFSSDLMRIDNQVLAAVFYFIQLVIGMLFNIVTIICTSPLSLIPCVILIPYFRQLQEKFRASAREVRRISSTTRSPVFSAFTEALSGVSTVRAYGRETHFSSQNKKRLLSNLSAFYNSNAIGVWLETRLGFAGGLIYSVVVIFAVLQHQQGWNISVFPGSKVSAGVVGLALSQATYLTNCLEYIIRLFTSAEMSLVSLERLLTFIELPPEAPLEDPADESNSSKYLDSPETKRKAPETAKKWPLSGRIRFDGVKMRYRQDLPLVLRGLSFELQPGKSLGIVGRTGAGKSSILQVLFRMVESAEGTISVDGTDIRQIGLQRLRGGLAIIPQDLVLFSGSLRDNIDPAGLCSDEEIWHMLRDVELEKFVKSKKAGLSYEISPGGDNLAVGQQQLVCLARALIRKSHVCILDEATSNVDNETDSLIQRALVKRAVEDKASIITIAHRINTIVGNDYVMVMENGECVEFGQTSELLANADSEFSKLASASGLPVGSAYTDSLMDC
jgi:ATP-binding cassette subfamily C (CFTR/MRP) protein 1